MNQELREEIRKHIQRAHNMGIREVVISKKSALAQKTGQKTEKETDPKKELEIIRKELEGCKRCRLNEGRSNIVFGEGDPYAKLMFIGEAPGRDEDEQGRPFVGRAGQLLTKMIEAMGFKREQVYIANIVKSRPPDNRYPEPDEVAACYPFLLRQIEAIKPKIIVTLGNLATQQLLATKVGITALHGKFHDFHGIRLMPVYHPAYLLRNPPMKKPCWEDLKLVMKELK